jgi:hypothetical protein
MRTKLFIAKVEIHVSDGYEKSETIWATHPVYALDEYDAKDKVEDYYDKKGGKHPGEIRYSITDCDIFEPIE